MDCLLDINVLIARIDTDHEHHARVTRWWHGGLMTGWATCPVTENGFIRILGRPTYPGWPGTPEKAAEVLQKLIFAFPGHTFFPDDISLLNASLKPSLSRAHSTGITDLYLLALAVKHQTRFVTLDTRIQSELIDGGSSAYVVIESKDLR